MYVLIRTDGKYVTRPGTHKSYSSNLQDARVFPTKEDAERERCVENERVAAIADIMGR